MDKFILEEDICIRKLGKGMLDRGLRLLKVWLILWFKLIVVISILLLWRIKEIYIHGVEEEVFLIVDNVVRVILKISKLLKKFRL